MGVSIGMMLRREERLILRLRLLRMGTNIEEVLQEGKGRSRQGLTQFFGGERAHGRRKQGCSGEFILALIYRYSSRF